MIADARRALQARSAIPLVESSFNMSFVPGYQFCAQVLLIDASTLLLVRGALKVLEAYV